MEYSWKISVTIAGLFLLGSCLSAKHDGISKDELLAVFQSVNLETARDPITMQGRQGVQRFLKERMSRIVSVALSGRGVDPNGNTFQEQNFQTKIFVSPRSEERFVYATNYIVVLQGAANIPDDVPLAIVANYDTDISETNPVDDNGSGIVALIGLGDHLAHKIASGKLRLDRTVILAATDIAIAKYEYGIPHDGRSGGDTLVRNWLPNFMNERKKFGGAIVLDSIMNFNDEARSQVNSSVDFSKAFPLAYQKMSEREFKGDFLALVQRDDSLDNPLAQAFERGWRHSKSVVEDGRSLTQNQKEITNPELIKFVFRNHTFNSQAELHFLKSEQAQFWNHFVRSSTKQLPAILLTDTEKYRKTECIYSGCTLAKMATSQNMEFLERTTNAVYTTIIQLQTDGDHSGAGHVQTSAYTGLIVLCGLMFRQALTNTF